MSVADYRAATELIERDGGGDFVGPRPDVLVADAEGALGLPFPAEYRAFVSDLGAGDVGGQEFFGIVDANFVDSSIPDAVWLTLRERQDSGLPGHLILVHATGDGGYHAVDTAGAVVLWAPGRPDTEEVAPSFGEFFRRTVEEALA